MTKISFTEQDLFHKFWNVDISFLGDRVTHNQLCCERPRDVDQPVSHPRLVPGAYSAMEFSSLTALRGHSSTTVCGLREAATQLSTLEVAGSRWRGMGVGCSEAMCERA